MTTLPSSAAPPTEILARVHWLGLKQLSADTNSARFMSVWRLPQTTALVAQTLDRFSSWPGGGASNAASALLRPLLDDLVADESYLEIRVPTNSQPSTLSPQLSFALAIRLDDRRAAFWQTNLAAALNLLTGIPPVPVKDGWIFRQPRAPEWIEFSRSGDWTLVGWGPAAGDSVSNSADKNGGASVPASRMDTSDSLSKFADRIVRKRASSATNFWLEADLDPLRLFPGLTTFGRGAIGWGEATDEPGQKGEIPPTARADARPAESGQAYHYSTLNHLQLTVTGKDGHVYTRGTFVFSKPLDLPLVPWQIPTNFIHGPLTSLTALRGLAPWLAAMPAWQKLEFTPAPDQAYVWSQAGTPFQTYFAAPLPGASNQVRRLADRLVQNGNPWLATNAQGNFQWATNPGRLVWNEAFIISPWLVPVTENQRDYVLGGLYAIEPGNFDPASVAIRRAILDTTNLVYYQSELTGDRLEDYFFITQLFRVIFHKSQLPPHAAATAWLKEVEPKTGASTTLVIQSGPEQLAFTRASTVGLTALELHLLADWLESPQFPHGLHTFLAPPDK